MDGQGDGPTISKDYYNGHPNTILEPEAIQIEQEALERKIRLGMASEHITSIINNCRDNGAPFIDLSKKSITAVPEDLLSLTHLQVRNNVILK